MDLRSDVSYDFSVAVPRESSIARMPINPEPFGKYLLLERIGAGGMAEVFKGIVGGPQGFQRSLVIKRMLPHLSQDAAFVQMFIDEAKLSGLLSHPNLVQIFEFGKAEDSYFIAMEYVHGRTLSDVKTKLVENNRQLSIPACVEIVRQISVGLHYAHSMTSPEGNPLGIVHRDISPPNLMLAFHGGVKILDFGIARVAAGMRETRTQVGMMKGKIAYMSPEQLQLEDVDHRSDIFAVGIVLHEILTGKRLFRSNSDYTSSRMVLELEIQPPSVHNPEIPPELDAIVMRALKRRREDRYATAGEMATALEQMMQDKRYSSHEHKRILQEIYPVESTQVTDAGLTVSSSIPTPLEGGPGDELPTSHLSHEAMTSATSRPRYAHLKPEDPPAQKSRTPLILGVVGILAVAGGAAFVLRGRRIEAPLPPPAAPIVQEAPRPAKPVQSVVRISVDSVPQDARVIRVDSSEVMGQTPLTIDLPQTAGLVALRFEKTGFVPVIHKVLTDLDKSVRVDLTPVGGEAEAHGPPAPARIVELPKRPGPPPHHVAPPPHHGPVVAAPAKVVTPDPAAAAAKDDCFMTIGSMPWAYFSIDGKDAGQHTPAVHLPVRCGKHQLHFKRESMSIDKVVDVNVTAGKELKQSFDLAPDDG